MSHFDSRRELFPSLSRFAYLNWAGTGPVSNPATEAACAQLRRLRDEQGRDPDAEVVVTEEVRSRVASLIGATPREVALTSNTTQGLGWVSGGLGLGEGDRVVVQGGTFPSVLYPWLALRDIGVIVDVVESVRTEGRPEWPLDAFAEAIAAGREPVVVAVSWVHYETGFTLDLVELGRLAHAAGAFLCADVVQGFGVRPFDVGRSPVDFAAAGSHKWVGAPGGAGFLYVAGKSDSGREVRLRPLEPGWNSVRHRGDYGNLAWNPDDAARLHEGGTPDVVSLSAYGAALGLLQSVGMEAVWERARGLAAELARGLRGTGLGLLSSDEDIESCIVAFRTRGDPTHVAETARRHGVVVAAPRAGGVRASVHAWNDEEDLARLLEVVGA